MESTFIYYKNLRFDDKKKFSIDFSNEDLLEGVVFKKNKDYYITSMACYVDFNIDITAQQNYTKIKQTSDLATTILRCDVDVGYGRKKVTLGKTSGSYLIFCSDKSRRGQYIENLEFFDVENKKLKNVHIYSAYKKLKDSGLKFLTTKGNSPIKTYTVQFNNDLKILTRFLNDIN